MEFKADLELAKKERKENERLAAKLRKKKPRDLDDVVHEMHYEEFEHIDCMECANCCKTTSPAMGDRDVDRMAKHLKMKSADLIAQYMHLDGDGDYVFNEAPCPFLAGDNGCMVYESRPAACREYPHTNRKRFYQVVDLSLKNAEICPAVSRIFERLKPIYLKEKQGPKREYWGGSIEYWVISREYWADLQKCLGEPQWFSFLF